MSIELFGVNVANVIRSVTQGQLVAGTLIRRTRTGIKNYVFEGAPDDTDEALNAQSVATSAKSTIIIIANSIVPKSIPLTSDILNFNNQNYKILSIETDGAEATYTCHVSLR